MTNATPDPVPVPEAPLTRRQVRDAQAPRRSRLPAPAYAPSRTERRSRRATVAKGPVAKGPVAKKVFSGAALLLAGAMAVGMSVPASAFQPESARNAAEADVVGRTLAVSEEARAGDITASNDYSITTYAEQLAVARSATSGTYDPTTGSIRWPFPYSSTITDRFGPRVSPCAGCSTNHKGVDFTPGAGVRIYAIAAGTVSSVVYSYRGLGHFVVVDHEIDGHLVQSVYAHMMPKSMSLRTGDTVEVGDVVGFVGSTGAVTAPHLHFELKVDGAHVDPIRWLETHATDEK